MLISNIAKAEGQLRSFNMAKPKSRHTVTIKGKVWCGFKNECKDKTPCYIIPKPFEDGVFLCDILKKYAGKIVSVVIHGVPNNL